MNILLKDLGRFLLKFCWIIVICAVLGGVLGFVTKKDKPEKEDCTYRASAKFVVDLLDLEDYVNDSIISGGATDDKNVFSAYNAAYSLLPSFKEILLSRSSVVDRVVYEYNLGVTDEEDKLTADDLLENISVDFPTSSLTFDMSYSAEKKTECEQVLRLMCKYGVLKVNQYSNMIKIKLSTFNSYTASVAVSGEKANLDAYKTKITQNYENIFNYVNASLTDNEYIQLFDVANGFSFVESDGVLTVSYESNFNKCVQKALEYVTATSFATNVTIGESQSNAKVIEEFNVFEIEKLAQNGPVNNTLVLAVFGAVLSAVILCVIFIFKTNKEKSTTNN